MNHRIALAAVLLAGLMLAAPPAAAAAPTKLECIAANDAAQDFRRAGKLGKAREQLVVCVSKSCPGPVREDCAQRLDEVDRAMPTIVFELKDRAGNDVSAAHITMDGQPLAAVTPRGTAVAVDPGEHRFAFDDADGLAHAEKTITVREGDKDRHVGVVLGASSITVPADRAPAPPAIAFPSDGSMQRTIGLLVGGLGVVAIGVGTIFGLNAISKNSDSNANGHCDATGCDSAGSALRNTALLDATVSNVTFGVGIAALAGAAILYLTAPSTASRGRTAGLGLSPQLGRDGGGLTLRGAW